MTLAYQEIKYSGHKILSSNITVKTYYLLILKRIIINNIIIKCLPEEILNVLLKII